MHPTDDLPETGRGPAWSVVTENAECCGVSPNLHARAGPKLAPRGLFGKKKAVQGWDWGTGLPLTSRGTLQRRREPSS